MNSFDDTRNPLPDEPENKRQEGPDDPALRIVVNRADLSEGTSSQQCPEPTLPAANLPPPHPLAFLPMDLRINWTWLHFLFMVLFIGGLIVAFPIGITVYLLMQHSGNMGPQQLQEAFQAMQTRPEIQVGLNVVLFLLVLLFLYFILAVFPKQPFWSTLGWKKFDRSADAPSNPWVYLGGGVALAFGVALVSSMIKTPEHLPLQELFKSRAGAFSLMAMAVFLAPLVEETVFRGFLYPLVASSVARVARKYHDPPKAIATGTVSGIVLTGFLFGVMHGAQLGWTVSLVAMLTTVGVIFTLARARAGTVLASFLMHFGYNSAIALSAIISTRGFTHMPPHS